MLARIKAKLGSAEAQYLALFAILGFFIMLFCSYTSPAFYFDYSPDNNAFFTTGKAMMHGQVLYKDIFEQKGPYVYLLHGLVYLVSHRSFILIYGVEALTLIAAMYLTYRIARLILPTPQALLMGILSPALFLYHPYYDYGDTVEFFAVPLILSLIYLVLLLAEDRQGVQSWWYFLQGLFVGIIFLSKYTLLGGWIAFYLFMLVALIRDRDWPLLRRLVGWSLLGFLVATVPWAIYFAVTHSFGALINVYFLFNMRIYMTSSVSAFSNLLQSTSLLSQFFLSDVVFFVLGLVGTLVIAFRTDILKNSFAKSLYLVVFLSSDVLALYGYSSGNVFQYYQLVYFPFFVLPFIYFCRFFFDRQTIVRTDDAGPILVTILISLFLVLGVNNNFTSSRLFPNNASVTDRHTTVPQEPAQIQFGNLMRRSGQPLTLLNYGSIDMGFYTASGAVPDQYYFQNYNIPARSDPTILADQLRSIRRAKTEWVVFNTPKGKSPQAWTGISYRPGQISDGNLNPGTAKMSRVLYQHYRYVTKHTQSFENVNVTYWLFQRKS
ncbi:glycosyltransferase family 39 protein [Levilactobacillus suantsaii]|uniref:Teichoic acid glycosyl transferase n=1 Tax=Levilactobacillus suantsaii TaxID=2292255 RepID=A0A4Q0VJH3_9LACO|nr:glycosyltransferase family 39 protein [Levilactobacillus suantsaii]QMU08317.1 glycosyltransferase family 39 protein [Levilactobacillus suantsaii]RXI78743.1 teichoic acid glycosyl transferase [Levilactobacillus suantsaii]